MDLTMKPTFIPSTLALGAALWLIPLTSTFAQSAWTNVDEFVVGASGVSLGLAAVEDGVVFSAGSGNDLAGVQHAFVRRSLDGGQTWQTVNDLPNSGTAMSWAVTVGRHSGLVFATATLTSGKTRDGSLKNDWVTLRSADGGTTWTNVDVVSPPNWKANPNAVVEDPAGRVFVAGYMGDANNADHFFIRRTLDGGTTWKTVDDQAPGGLNQALSLAATPAGVFAAGWLRNVWTVRRSTDGGTTWKTVDSFLAAPAGYFSHARGIAADTNGNLYVTGHSQFLVNKGTDIHWITRRSTDNGATWRTVDDTLAGSNSGFGYAVTVDAFGRVFATGTYASVSGSTWTNHWVTRASADGGATWVTTDDYIALGGALGSAAASDAVGNVFTSGKAKTALGNPTAVVRKLAAP
jgi:hypothetical protein